MTHEKYTFVFVAIYNKRAYILILSRQNTDLCEMEGIMIIHYQK